MLTRARLSRYRSLHRPGVRRREGLYLVEGRRLVAEAIRAAPGVEDLLVTAAFAEANADLLDAARTAGIEANRVAERELARLSELTTPPGVLAVVRRAVIADDVPAGGTLYLALDGVSDPGNVGTLVRAADAFGAAAVIGGGGTADFENGKVLRSAMGSTFHIPLFRTDDLPAALVRLRDAGGRLVAATLDGEDLYAVAPTPDPVCVILGSEAHGVSAAALALADHRVTVPSPGRADSLNVAMAGSIVLSWLARSLSEHWSEARSRGLRGAGKERGGAYPERVGDHE